MALVRWFGSLVCSVVMLTSCGDDGGGDEGSAGQLGQPCLGGTFCNDGLMCSAGVCVSEGNDEVNDAETTEGDSTDGSTDTTTTGDTSFPLYEGPCTASEECEGGGWCADSYGFCSMACMEDEECPSHPGATALPQCTAVFSEVGGNSMFGCALECEAEADCPPGTKCWAVGTSTWCGY